MRPTAIAAGVFIFLTTTSAMAIDLTPLWDFSQPDVSEQRFRAALKTASVDDALVLQTQIARSYGLRKDFAAARDTLKAIEPQMATAGTEARTRYALELGRTYASATHPADAQTTESRELARTAYRSALDLAKEARLDSLAIDAIHMLAFVDTSPADQLKWGLEALSVVTRSTQAAAKQWEAPVRHNVGYALHQLGRYDEALAQFRQAVVLREQGGDAQALRVAHWMVAWTLRSLKRNEEALDIQLRLEREADDAGQPDPYVFEELELLYRDRNDAAKAAYYASRKQAVAR